MPARRLSATVRPGRVGTCRRRRREGRWRHQTGDQPLRRHLGMPIGQMIDVDTIGPRHGRNCSHVLQWSACPFQMLRLSSQSRLRSAAGSTPTTSVSRRSIRTGTARRVLGAGKHDLQPRRRRHRLTGRPLDWPAPAIARCSRGCGGRPTSSSSARRPCGSRTTPGRRCPSPSARNGRTRPGRGPPIAIVTHGADFEHDAKIFTRTEVRPHHDQP